MTHAIYPSLKGRTVFISGGASGIGADLVTAFAAQGSNVGFVDIDDASGEALAQKLGAASVLYQHCDITDIEALRAAIAAVRTRFGPIGVLLNNAANDTRHKVADVTPEFFDRTVAVNLKHQYFAAQAVAPDMAQMGGGSIVNLGSVSWMNKNADLSVYATCKSAAQGLSRTLARDLGKQNIRVNTIVPGWVMTERQLKLWVKPESAAEIDAAQCLPGRVMGTDIAAMALFLAADDSRMCSAQNFIVDAGWS
ncbi:SDR family oxidoreductase [Variovorax humicola]|uniref:SDR family oxidoreductase n=1 Tax=Variovorax humicola TaxID=1769758 RepID=A0ABU8W2P1_9BURK